METRVNQTGFFTRTQTMILSYADKKIELPKKISSPELFIAISSLIFGEFKPILAYYKNDPVPLLDENLQSVIKDFILQYQKNLDTPENKAIFLINEFISEKIDNECRTKNNFSY